MKVIAVDDERLALENLLERFKEIPRIKEYKGFQTAEEMLSYLEENADVNIAFLDINMGSMDGLTLAKKVRELSPGTFIVFVTGYSEYAVQAFEVRAVGYLLKPASTDSIAAQIEYIQELSGWISDSRKLKVRCFGDFAVFGEEDRPFHFKRQKEKELLAYLIDRRGAFVTNEKLCEILWEEGGNIASKKSQLRIFIADLVSELAAHKMSDVLIRKRNRYAIDIRMVDCDYYRFLDMEPVAVNQYCGEYMSQYSWAEMTLGYLENMR